MRYFYFFSIFFLFLFGCQPETTTEPIDLTAVKLEINTQLDNFYSLTNARNIEAYKTYLTDDGLYCGTDPEEFFSKEKLIALSVEMFANDSLELKYSIDKRVIRVASDGKSAISVEQSTVEWISANIPVRIVSHLVKIENNWKIDFFSWSLVPNNADIGKLNKALE